MHCTFLSSALLFSAAARFASAQDATLTTSLDSAQTTSFDSAQTTSFDSAQTTSYNSAQTTADSAEPSLDPLVSSIVVAVNSIQDAFASTKPSLFSAAGDAFAAAIPTNAPDKLYNDLYFDPAAPDAAAIYSQIPSQYVGILTSVIGAEGSAIAAIVGTTSIPSDLIDDPATTTDIPTILPTPTGTSTRGLETLTSSKTVSGTASGLTTITTAPKSSGSSTEGASSKSGSSSGLSSGRVSAASQVSTSTASTATSTGAAAPMQTGGIAGMVVAAVGIVGVAML